MKKILVFTLTVLAIALTLLLKWYCTNCGQANPDHVSTCDCGKSKLHKLDRPTQD